MSIAQQCPNAITCPGTDSPFLNLSAEGPEGFTFISNVHGYNPPPLGFEFSATGCLSTCTSTNSQLEADQCAAKQAYLCGISHQTPPAPPPVAPGSPPQPPPASPGPPVFFNQAVGCTFVCPDGTPFTVQLPAGIIAGPTQAQADSQAYQDACQVAGGRHICLSDLDKTNTFVGEVFTGKITAVGSSLAKPGSLYGDQWTIIQGELPPGLSFDGGSAFGVTAFGGTEFGATVSIVGTPTTDGVYGFTVQVVDPIGDYQRKAFLIKVVKVPKTITVTGWNNQVVACNLSFSSFDKRWWIGQIDPQTQIVVNLYTPIGKPAKGWITVSFVTAFTSHAFEYDAVAGLSDVDPSGVYKQGNAHFGASFGAVSPIASLTVSTP